PRHEERTLDRSLRRRGRAREHRQVEGGHTGDRVQRGRLCARMARRARRRGLGVLHRSGQGAAVLAEAALEDGDAPCRRDDREGGRVVPASIARDAQLGPATKFARVTGDQPMPAIVPSSKPGEWLIAWLDYETGHLEPYAARVLCK